MAEKEQGVTGIEHYSGRIRDDYNKNLQFPDSVDTYDKMRRNDPQVRMTLSAVKLPIRQASWFIEPASEDRVDEEIADFVEENLLNNWKDRLRQTLLMIEFGFMLWEIVEAVQDGQIVWKKLAPRLPKSLDPVKPWIQENGKLKKIKQHVFNKKQVDHEVDAENLLRFTLNQEGSNFEGISMIRSSVKPWRIKNELNKYDAIRHERFSVGIPIVELPEDADEDDEEKAETMAKNMRANQQGYGIIPHGSTAKILTPENSDPTGIENSLDYYNMEIARSVLGQFMMLGESSSGNRALAQTLVDFFTMGLNTVADEVADVFNGEDRGTEYNGIKELVDKNFANVDQYPELKHSRIDRGDLEQMSKALKNLAGVDLLTPDDETENHLRNQFNLPEKDEDEPESTSSTSRETPDEDPDEDETEEMTELQPEIQFREPNDLESALLNFEEMEKSLNGFESKWMNKIKDIRDRQFSQIMKVIRPAIENQNLQQVQNLTVPLQETMRETMREIMDEAFGFGQNTVQEEIERQQDGDTDVPQEIQDKREAGQEKVSLMEWIGSFMFGEDEAEAIQQEFEEFKDLRSKQAAERINRQLDQAAVAAASQEIRRLNGMDRQGDLAPGRVSQSVSTVRDDLDTLSTGSISDEAAISVSTAFQLGRQAQAEILEPTIEQSVWSTLLDNASCDNCRPLNGQTLSEIGFEPPNPDCLGGNRCRCIGVHMTENTVSQRQQAA